VAGSEYISSAAVGQMQFHASHRSNGHLYTMVSLKTEAAVPISEVDISALVDAFYAKVQHDAVIGPIFNEAVEDWPAHLALLKGFWASVLLGIGQFKGNPLETHMKLPISREHFERWLALFAETATELLPPEKAKQFIDKSQRIAETFQRGMAARRNGLEVVSTHIRH
jgi:hemoglobin